MSIFDTPPEQSWLYHSWYYSSFLFPLDVGKDLIRAAVRILKDQNELILDEDAFFMDSEVNVAPTVEKIPPGLFRRLLRRFILGLPMVGAVSVVQALLSLGLLSPVHLLARYRGNRSRRGDTRDIAAMVVIMVLLVGAAR